MKRLLILSCFVLFSLAVGAQSRYVVYKCGGDVKTMKFRSQEWTPVQKNDELVLMDMIRVGEDASLVVLDKRNRSLYRFEEGKERSLKALIDEAVKKSDNVTADLNRELISGSGVGEGEAKDYRQLAAAYRTSGAAVSYEDSLAVYLKSGIGSVPVQDGDVECRFYDYPELSDRLKCTVLPVAEGEISFVFTNTTGNDVFVNVVCVNKDGERNLCYDPAYSGEYPFILVPSGQEVSLPQYVFAVPDGEFHYMMLASSRPFDSHRLQMLLR